MSAWVQTDEDDASHQVPPPAEQDSGRPAWLAPLLMTTALLLIAFFLIVIMPNALGDSPGGGCGGG